MPVHHSICGTRQNQLFLCTSHTDIAKPAFLLHARIRIHRPLSRKESVLHSRQENDRKFQSFCTVHRHQSYLARRLIVLVGIAVCGDLFKKFFERCRFARIFLLFLVIVYKRFEIHEVFYPALRFDGIFVFECLHIACPNEQIIIYIRNSEVFLFAAAKQKHLHHRLYRLYRPRRKSVQNIFVCQYLEKRLLSDSCQCF